MLPRLSAAAGVAVNAPTLKRLLTEGGTSQPSEVVLDIEGVGPKDVADQLKELYDVAADVNFQTQLDIVLRSGATATAPLTKEVLGKNLGYELHHHVALGGTFDRLHPGHKLLLTTSLLHTENKLRVGVTGPELLKKKKFGDMLQPFDDRVAAVRKFLEKQRSDVFFDVVELTEPTGGTTAIEDVTAMVCSPETLPAIVGINEARSANGFAPVVPVSIEYVGGDDKTRVSSTALREKAQQQQQQPQ